MNVDRFIERKWLYSGKGKKCTISLQTITDADYANDMVLMANTPA